MIYGPKIGESVRLHYKASVAKVASFRSPIGFGTCHGAVGRIEIIGRGPGPMNLGVRVGAHLIVVPRGNVVRRPPCDSPQAKSDQ